ncbi:YheC/YheD family protein [Paenibacillus xerothermodurans]|nr:YheC/YheD family protein [Paenibacillus xerothermodurans]
MKHRFVRSKYKKGKPLMADRQLGRHVPKTSRFAPANLRRMLRAFPVLYVKPDGGTGGAGIIRVRRVNRSHSLIAFDNIRKKSVTRKVSVELRRFMYPRQKYIIQQGIPLATCNGRPFDIRVVLQRPRKKWRLTWISAKVAPKRSSIVTNVARGAKDAKILETLRAADQPLPVPKILKELRHVSHQIAQKLGSRFPIRIVGLDMAVDRKGKIWFIEANTQPNMHGLQQLDPKQYRRYLRAKRFMQKRL